MLTFTTFLAGLIGTVALGAPLVSRLASAATSRGWRKGQPTDAEPPVRHHVTRHFQPLDLGPDPTDWPSKKPWPESRIAEADWPSKGWDDEHFGAHWKKQADASPPRRSVKERAVDAAEAVEGWFAQDGSERKKQAQAEMQKAADKVAKAQAVAEQTARRAAQVAQQAAKVAESKAPKAVKNVAKKAQAAAQKVEAGAAAAQRATEAATKAADMVQNTLAGKPPTREEIRAMVDEYGLAGAVKKIMDQTGWDFRAAAQYLSQHR